MRNQTRKLNILRLFGYISFMCVTKTGFCDDELYENSTCYQSGIVGTCKRITNCPQALKEASKGRPHKMLRCGFVDMDLQVVCCPDPTDTLRILNAESTTTNPLLIWDTRVITATPRNLTGNTKRKCEIMCEKIYKDNNIRAEIETHVINGKSAKYGQFPHMAAIGYAVDDQIDWKKCGASLISSRFLLTAAHCFVCPDCKAIKVRIGVINITDEASAQDIDIKAITVTGYNYTTKHHDIALIELTKDVIMSKTVYPACLYTGTDDPNGLSISGWGQTDSSNLASRSDILQTAEITAVAVGECNTTITKTNRASAKIIVSTQICATYVSDACLGDSGGPLQRPKSVGGFDIVGIISYGIGCGVHPGVYTRVSSFLDWIESVVWPS